MPPHKNQSQKHSYPLKDGVYAIGSKSFDGILKASVGPFQWLLVSPASDQVEFPYQWRTKVSKCAQQNGWYFTALQRELSFNLYHSGS